MKIRDQKYKSIYVLIYSAVVVFYLWMAAQIPYTHDDWDWGLPIGIEQLVSASLNSRYAGNCFEVVMTRSETIKTLVMGLGYWLIPFLLSELAICADPAPSDRKRLLCFMLCNILLLTMNRTIWQQTYGWVAGYANFVISAIFAVIVVQKTLSIFEIGNNTQESKKQGFIWFGVGLVSQMFIENIALFLFALSLYAFVYYYLKNRSVSFSYLGLMIGSFAGLLVIFGSDIYQELWITGSAVDGYRKVFVNSEMSVHTVLMQCYEQTTIVIPRIWENNLLISSTVLLLLICGLFTAVNKNEKLRVLFFVANILILVYFISSYLGILTIQLPFKSLIGIVYFLVVAAESAFLFGEDKAYIKKLLLVWICAPAVIAPLIITSACGPRLFFTSNVLLIMFAAMVFVRLINHISQLTFNFIQAGLSAVIVCLLIYHGNIYYDIGICKAKREAIIVQAIETNADYICLPPYPHTEFLWRPNPYTKKREIFFKDFYGIDQSVTVEFKE